MLARASKKTTKTSIQESQTSQGSLFDQENFGFKPSKMQIAADNLKVNKRVSAPIENPVPRPVSNFSRPGNIWKMSAQPALNQEAAHPSSINEDSVLKEKNKMDIEWRREYQPPQPYSMQAPLSYMPRAPQPQSHFREKESSQNHMDEEMPEPKTYLPERTVEKRDELQVAREKKKRVQSEAVQPDEDLEEMRRKHREMINEILVEEDSLLLKQKNVIDTKVSQIKEEMLLLNSVERGDCNYSEYVTKMKEYIAIYVRREQDMLAMLQGFEDKLSREKMLASRIQQKENQQSIHETFSSNLLNGVE